MGRRHQVDYPPVPRSHQLNEEPIVQYNSRYSWMDNPADTDRRHYTPNVQTQPEIKATPPPTIPETRSAEPVELPTPDLPHDAWVKSKEAGIKQETHSATLNNVQAQNPHIEQKSSSIDVKVPEKAIYPEKYSDVKPLVPDANPLSSRVPQYTSRDTRRNTNMGVLSPPDTDFTPTHYQQLSQPIRGGSWHHGLGSCAEPSTCMTGLFCPCILYGKVQYRLSLKSEKKDGTNMLGYKTVNGSCIAWALLCGINGVLAGIQRSRIRRSYEMAEGSGNCFGDCVQGCCCCCCVLAQNEKEMKGREEGSRRAGASEREGYVPPKGMTFSSQNQ